MKLLQVSYRIPFGNEVNEKKLVEKKGSTWIPKW